MKICQKNYKLHAAALMSTSLAAQMTLMSGFTVTSAEDFTELVISYSLAVLLG